MSYKSSTGRNIGKLLNVFQSGKTILGQGIGGGGSAAAVFSATGGTLVQSGGYNYHVFTQPDIFSVTNTTGVGVTATILLVGGGGSYGGGSPNLGGGGGAGGVYQIEHSMSFTVNTPVSIGSAGGNPTSFGNHIAFGGGNGGSFIFPGSPYPGDPATFAAISGKPGGSGGGSSIYFTPGGTQAVGAVGVATTTATFPKIVSGLGTVTFRQGSPGSSNPGGGAAGGGSSGTGSAAAPFSNFPGPIISPAIPAPVSPSWNPIVGPTGLYGAGSGSSVNFTGNGGGSGPGGSGIVIIRYLTP